MSQTLEQADRGSQGLEPTNYLQAGAPAWLRSIVARLALAPLGLLTVLCVSAAWRLPSLFDPPMVQDEGTYFAVAQAMSHGYRLYADVWENKPPALYLLYGGIYHLFGPSLFAVRVVTAFVVLFTVFLVFLIARAYARVDVAVCGAMLAGLLFGVPFLEGTTGNAEIFLAAFSALGVYFALVRGRPGWAGAALALAVLFKAVAGLDAVALGLYLLVQRRDFFWRYLLALSSALILTGIVAWLYGILPYMLRDAGLYDVGYVGHANGGSIPWVLVLKFMSLLICASVMRRAPFPYLWLGFATVGALMSGRWNGHYALQILAPTALCAVLILRHRHRLTQRLTAALPASCFALAGVASLIGWGMVAEGQNTAMARHLQWYGNFVKFAVGAEPYGTYRRQIDEHVDRNLRIARAVAALPPGRILVWGNVPWVYVLSGRLPVTRYTTAQWQPEVPGETADLRGAIMRGEPSGVVVINGPSPSFGSAESAFRRLYRHVRTIGNASIYQSVR